MANQQKSLSIIIVELGGMVVCSPLNPAGATFSFPAGMISNMGVIKPDDLHAFISSICTAQQLVSKDVLMVFGNSLLFQKQIGILPEDKTAEAIQSFQNIVPFDWVATKIYKAPTGSTIVAINRDFFDILKQSFEKNTVTVIAVVPQFIFTQWLGKQTLNAKTLVSLFTKSDSIIEQTLVTSRSAPRTFQQQEEYLSKRYSGLIVVGFILFIILVFVATGFVLRRQSQSVKKPATQTVASPSGALVGSIASPLPSPDTTLTASPSGVRITIAFGQKQASASGLLRQAFAQKGFTSVSLQPQSTVTVDKPILLLRPSVTPAMRTALVSAMQTIIPDFSTQESSDLENDVFITLGN